MDLTPPPSMNGDAEGPCTKVQCLRSRGILERRNAALLREKAAIQTQKEEADEEVNTLRRDITRLRGEINRLRRRQKHTQRVCITKGKLELMKTTDIQLDLARFGTPTPYDRRPDME